MLTDVGVTPLAGVWIEIPNRDETPTAEDVTPLAGVWIEIPNRDEPPTAEDVTPLAGVWIEIGRENIETCVHMRHSPCGSVD